jgi:hypothetical protein
MATGGAIARKGEFSLGWLILCPTYRIKASLAMKNRRAGMTFSAQSGALFDHAREWL